jgi:L-seryl-tRNA(Ser) seleniumtransferase
MRKTLPPELEGLLRQIPSVEEVLADVRPLADRLPRWALVDAVRDVLHAIRQQVMGGTLSPEEARARLEAAAIGRAVEAAAARRIGGSLRRVINATGVVIHTNLGRAPLAKAALQAIREAAAGYSNLEFDLERGERGSRQAHVEALLCTLTGAEAALVVNNNAAAVFLAIHTLAAGREVVISRGELVEIGDSFRIPDVMTQAGGRLREVGATNRTHLADYAEAIGPATALLLKVHRSNFRLLGFTAEADSADLAALGRQHGLPAMEDLGSGALVDLSALGLRREPMVADAIRAGLDLVTFSGDKLLGGPQAGIIVGRRDLVGRLRKNPVARSVRLDKLCLAGLEATLRLLRDPVQARQQIPILRMLGLSREALAVRADGFARALAARLPEVAVAVEDGLSEVGGGALPLQELPTRLVALSPGPQAARTAEAALRHGTPAVLVRIKEDRLVVDLRTVAPDEEPELGAALQAALRTTNGKRPA